MENIIKLATPHTMYPRHCVNCGSVLSWQSDFNFDEVYHDDIADGFVSFHCCVNDECGLMYQSDYLDELGYIRIIPIDMNEDE